MNGVILYSILNKFDRDDWNAFHDVVYDVLGEPPDDYKLGALFAVLPEHIQMKAVEWGMGDSVFRDDAYLWFQENRLHKMV